MLANRNNHVPPTDSGTFRDGLIAAITLLQDADEKSQSTGGRLLTDEGVCYLRHVLATICSGNDAPAIPILPHWDRERMRLWLGGQVLVTLGHRQSYLSMIPMAFQEAGWAKRRVPDPLPRSGFESATDAHRRLQNTLKNLNRELPPGTIRFHVESNGAFIRWDYSSESANGVSAVGAPCASEKKH